LIGAVLVTHGNLGGELLAVAKRIVGEVDHLVAVSVGWDANVDASKRAIQEAVRQVDSGQGVVILTDMFGGTPSNISLSLLEKDRLEIVTGVNLAMAVKMASQKEGETLSNLARQVCDQGIKQISVAGEVLGE
jgi:PTS system mannose-specific IIA component